MRHLVRRNGRFKAPLQRWAKHEARPRACGVVMHRPEGEHPCLVRDLGGRYWWFGIRAGFDQ